MIAGINEIKYPIYHLDFESFPARFQGLKAKSLFTKFISVFHSC